MFRNGPWEKGFGEEGGIVVRREHRKAVASVPAEGGEWQDDILVQVQQLKRDLGQVLIAHQLNFHVVKLTCMGIYMVDANHMRSIF